MPVNLIRSIDRRLGEWIRSWRERDFSPGSMLQGRYTIIQRLGMGSYGVTYLCREIITNECFVLKRVQPLRRGSDRAKLIYDREIGMLQRLDNPNIPKLYEQFHYRNHFCFIMEYMEGESLNELLFHKGRTFTEKESLQILRSLLSIVAYFHSLGIIHRDISISNVLLHQDAVQIIDFGLAWNTNETAAAARLVDGLSSHDPQEKKLRRMLHVSSDFYGIGHLLLFMLYSTFPENEESPEGEKSWEDELTIHPGTKNMLRRLLMVEPPFAHANEVANDVERILLSLQQV